MGSTGSTVTCVLRAVRAGMQRGIHQGVRRGMSGGMWWLGVAAAVVVSLAGVSLAQAAPRSLAHGSSVARGPSVAAGSSVAQPADQWPDYLETNGHTGFNSAETRINATSATGLSQQWTYAAPGPVSDQPIEANGLVYVGSWDGYERALTTRGQVVWSTFLGTTSDSICDPTEAGVASTPFVTQPNPEGIHRSPSMLYVGGGDGQLYALNALTGAIVWVTRLGPSPATFIWSSPLVYGGSVYIGVASFGDCPLVQGQLVQLNAASGAVQHTFNVVPNTCTGAGVWGSPTLDVATGIIYFATGNPGDCSTNEVYSDALMAVHMSDLSLASYWQVPPSQLQTDEDCGSSATLFAATIGGTPRTLIGIVCKNGLYYAFDRTNLAAGPIWTTQIAIGGSCPQCGDAPIAPAAWDGQTLYVAGGTTTIGGQTCQGSVQALNPATGAARWQRCINAGPVLGAVTAVPGVVFAGAGAAFYALSASTGAILFSYTDPQGQVFYGPASVASGSVYIGNVDGTLSSFGVGTSQ